jgi:hypothetical protein
MTKKIAAAIVLFLALVPGLRADWKSELLTLLSPRPDYRAAWDYLVAESTKLEPEDRQTAGALLPYLAGKLGDAVREQDLAAEYFETYRDNDPDFGFLDYVTLRDFLSFWARWKRSYPLVYDLNLLSYARSSVTGIPATVEAGLELLNDAFYRISLGPYILEGGHWLRGFHILTIPLSGLFERSGNYDFVLDLKSGDLVVRKVVRVRVDVADMAPPVAASPKDMLFPEGGAPRKSIQEGEISLYVDGKLVLRSRKIAAKPAPLSFPLPGPSMPGQKPYMPPPKDDPMARGVSILDALALAYKAIKDLVAKKPPKPSPPSYNKVSALSFEYSRRTAEGLASSARASVSLVPVRAVILRE